MINIGRLNSEASLGREQVQVTPKAVSMKLSKQTVPKYSHAKVIQKLEEIKQGCLPAQTSKSPTSKWNIVKSAIKLIPKQEEGTMKNFLKDLGKKGQLVNVVDFLLLKEKYSQENKEQSIMDTNELPLKYTKLYKVLPQGMYVNINKLDMRSIYGETDINDSAIQIIKVIWSHQFTLY